VRLPGRADLGAFCLMAGVQLLSYFLFSINARALAQGRMAWTFFSDLVFASSSYWTIKFVSRNQNGYGQMGYIFGGAFGSVLAILLTKRIFGM